MFVVPTDRPTGSGPWPGQRPIAPPVGRFHAQPRSVASLSYLIVADQFSGGR